MIAISAGFGVLICFMYYVLCIMLSEMSDRDKCQTLSDLTYMCNEQQQQQKAHRNREKKDACQEEWEMGDVDQRV